MPADGDINFAVFEHVTDVERAGHIGRRDDEREYSGAAPVVGMENSGVDPPLRPMRLEPLRLVHLLDLHGKYQYNRGADLDAETRDVDPQRSMSSLSRSDTARRRRM